MTRTIALTHRLTLMLLAGGLTTALPSHAVAQTETPQPGQAVIEESPAEAEARWAKAVADNPQDPRARFMLAYTVHASGDLDRAIELHQQAARFPQVRAMALYNLGCAYALRGEADQAFETLARTVKLGTRDRGQYETDTDLTGLHTDERWGALMSKIDTFNANPPEKALHFWAGQWDCYGATTGVLNGHNTLERRVKNNVIHESWTASDSTTGESWNYYNANRGTWRQIWMDDNGIALEMDAPVSEPRADGGVLFEGDQIRKDGTLAHIRMHVRPVGPGWVRQTGSSTSDGGQTWTTTYDLVYVPTGGAFDAAKLGDTPAAAEG